MRPIELEFWTSAACWDEPWWPVIDADSEKDLPRPLLAWEMESHLSKGASASKYYCAGDGVFGRLFDHGCFVIRREPHAPLAFGKRRVASATAHDDGNQGPRHRSRVNDKAARSGAACYR